jgi:hypothetical protein
MLLLVAPNSQSEGQFMDKLKLTGRTLGQLLNSRRVCIHAMHLLSNMAIRPNLELKTRPKLLLGSLPFDTALPGQFDWHTNSSYSDECHSAECTGAGAAPFKKYN